MLISYKTPIDASKFFCVRYSDDRTIKHFKDGFSTSKNPMLAAYVKYKALKEDFDNKQAVYFVKDCNKIVLFFSLKCGLLIKCHQEVLSGINHRINQDKIEYYIDDDIINVTDTLPALEISHFCVNETYKNKKSNWEITNCISEYSVGTYTIIQSIMIGNAEFVMGYNPKASTPYVTWECNNGNNYFWGHYIMDRHNAERDLLERATLELDRQDHIREMSKKKSKGGHER